MKDFFFLKLSYDFLCVYLEILNELWIESKRRMLSADRAEPERASEQPRIWSTSKLFLKSSTNGDETGDKLHSKLKSLLMTFKIESEKKEKRFPSEQKAFVVHLVLNEIL